VSAWLRRFTRPIVWVPIAVAVMVAAGGVVWWTHRSAPATSQSATAPALTADRAAMLCAGLTSGEPARVRGALAMPAGQALDPAAVAALAKLRVQMDPATFTANGPRTATVSGTITTADGTATPTLFALVHNTDGWQLVDTIQGT
jgi:hypothetical protein